ncbi:hypothetical protein TSOC_008375 [Tetrabaena socialis]|uniref:Uncharacterized protein n=1 Tax=Tetrabaena socialis TaxID=47790 RepID=A0A2J7ZYP1_9CHLO|nr:hypothetical protein TSOC_008375 [Tetrabaena socialis]|eukprot:PNH05380.1 hypothetical protein TSOC_008375 [Tetrabaena socialis]
MKDKAGGRQQQKQGTGGRGGGGGGKHSQAGQVAARRNDTKRQAGKPAGKPAGKAAVPKGGRKAAAAAQGGKKLTATPPGKQRPLAARAVLSGSGLSSAAWSSLLDEARGDLRDKDILVGGARAAAAAPPPTPPPCASALQPSAPPPTPAGAVAMAQQSVGASLNAALGRLSRPAPQAQEGLLESLNSWGL